MKKILFLSALFLMLGNVAFAAGSATLNWNANTESDLAGYKVYYGTASRGLITHPRNGGYTNNVSVTGTSKVISNLTEGKTYYFSVTAYDTSNNESAYSQEKTKFIPLSNTTTPTCTSWTYSAWSTCTNYQQTRTVVTSYPTGCTSGTPQLSRSCVPTSTGGSDITRPSISSFTIPSTASSYTVPISTFVATDNVGVTGYCISPVNSSLDCTWSSSPQTSYTFAADGKKYYLLYGFAKDAAGNLSYRAVDTVYIDAGSTTGGTTTPPPTTTTTTYTVGGTVSGLSGTLVLRSNKGEMLNVTSNGSFTFQTKFAKYAPYAVVVYTQPSGQTCRVAGAYGTIISTNVTNIQVTCTGTGTGSTSGGTTTPPPTTTTATYTVGGTVSGLSGTLVLRSNKGETLNITSNGSFTFQTKYAKYTSYAVVAYIQPSGQTCRVAGAYGTIISTNVTNIQVTCTGTGTGSTSGGTTTPPPTTTTATYTVGGTVSGLSGTLVLRSNKGETLNITSNGSFTFQTKYAKYTSYAVVAYTQPSGQYCRVAGGVGTIVNNNVSNIAVSCQ